ncbi:MAG: peptidoglycan-binding protein [Rhodospirillales bacterium]|nr:peptidoglycan-binding protein [Rhodospirillales bacterium]
MAIAKVKIDFVHLSGISGPVPLTELKENALRELQTALKRLGYPVGDLDGLYGPKTRNAWAEFKTDVYPGNPELIGPESVAALQEKLRELPSTGKPMLSTKESTIQAIKNECKTMGIGLPTQIAYVLATTQWETAQTFQPVKEAYWLSESWRKANFRYYPYYGRGYVQLTWKNNYKTYSDLIGRDMVSDPDIALEPAVSLFVLVHGFKTGAFTGRAITQYISEDRTDFVEARRCINGTDRANEIAQIAKDFLAKL